MPKVSVIMPAYNAEQYIQESINSILVQTETDLELIIIDDCSSDNTARIIESINDPRIIFIQNEVNLGVARTLNKGLVESHGEFIARMDADDISLPERLEKQIHYLKRNPEVCVLGTNVKLIGTNRKAWPSSKNTDSLKRDLLFNSCLCHPTVMFRGSLIYKNGIRYDYKFNRIEDYELWDRLIQNYDFACLQEPLFLYRVHNNQVSSGKDNDMYSKYLSLKKRIISRLRLDTSSAEFLAFVNYGFFGKIDNQLEKENLKEFLLSIVENNNKYKIYNPKLLNYSIGMIMLEICDDSEKKDFLITHKNWYCTTFRSTLGYLRQVFR